jgi:hypothetical protein
LKFRLPPGSPSMSYGGPSSGNPGVVPLKMADALSAEPAHPLVVFLAVPAVACVRPQTGSLTMAGHACACPLMGLLAAATQARPSFFVVAAAASRARATPRSLPQGSNASGFAVVAPSAPPASLTLAVPSVGAGAPFTSNDAPPGLCASTTAHSTAFAPVFPAAWTGPRPTPSFVQGSSHKRGNFKASRQVSMARFTEAAPLPGAMPRAQVSSDGEIEKG